MRTRAPATGPRPSRTSPASRPGDPAGERSCQRQAAKRTAETRTARKNNEARAYCMSAPAHAIEPGTPLLHCFSALCRAGVRVGPKVGAAGKLDERIMGGLPNGFLIIAQQADQFFLTMQRLAAGHARRRSADLSAIIGELLLKRLILEPGQLLAEHLTGEFLHVALVSGCCRTEGGDGLVTTAVAELQQDDFQLLLPFPAGGFHQFGEGHLLHAFLEGIHWGGKSPLQ